MSSYVETDLHVYPEGDGAGALPAVHLHDDLQTHTHTHTHSLSSASFPRSLPPAAPPTPTVIGG